MVECWLDSQDVEYTDNVHAVLSLHCTCLSRRCICNSLSRSLGIKLLATAFEQSGGNVDHHRLQNLLPESAVCKSSSGAILLLVRGGVHALNLDTRNLYAVGKVPEEVHSFEYLRSRLADIMHTKEDTLSNWSSSFRYVPRGGA
jgi:hypothetical protein